MERLLQDLRYGIRALMRSPGFAFTAILTLALGIAATTIVFSLMNALLLRPVPASEPDRLAMLNEEREGPRMTMNGYVAMPQSRIEAYARDGAAVLDDAAGERSRNVVMRRGDAPPEMANALVVTANWFDVVGLDASKGRLLSGATDADGSPTVVLGWRTWRDRFGADPNVVGSQIRLDGQPYTVVGVGPEKFNGLHMGDDTELWVPVEAYQRLHPGVEDPFGDGETWMVAMARLKDGVDRDAAAAALTPLARNMPLPQAEMKATAVMLDPVTLIQGEGRREATGFLAMSFVAAMLVLLIAGTNVTGMLLARATGRRREIAIRVAVGAERGRVIRQLVTEGVLLFVLGSAGALLLAQWALAALPAVLPPEAAALGEIRPDRVVLGFALVLALVSGVAFTIFPALQVSRTDLVPALKEGSSGSGSRMRVQRGFVVAQVAISFLLLIVAGLFVRTVQASFDTDVGFEPKGLVIAQIDPSAQGYDAEGGRDLGERLLERVRGLPGVDAAALALAAPLSGWVWNEYVYPSDAVGDSTRRLIVDQGGVGPGFMKTLGVPLMAGRDFDGRDGPDAPKVVIVNAAFVDSMFGGGDAVGRHIVLEDTVSYAIVGVVATTKTRDLRDDQRPFVYRSFAQSHPDRFTVMLRTRGSSSAALAGMRQALYDLDPDLALQEPRLLTDAIASQLFPQRFAATLVGFFGGIGLLLAAIGLYGILAYHVGQRTREIGVRVALGARAADVLAMVLRHGILLAVTGIAVGLVAAVAVTRLLASMLLGVSATDPVTFVLVPLLLTLVAVVASWAPARRATRVDPTVALRAE